MLIYMLKRIVYNIPVVLLLTIFVFAMVRFLPGDPADILLSGEGGAEDPVVRAQLMKELGLDKPIPIQYGLWLWRALHGNFGKSIYSEEEVFKLILDRFPATLYLAIFAMIVAIVVALPAGIISAVKRQKPADYGAMMFALLGISLPEFWFGIMLIIFFALWLQWLPSMGYLSPFQDFFGSFKFLILPAIALGLRFAGVLTRMTRSSMLDELGQDYVRTARSKGLSEKTVIWVHTLKNALIPTVTIAGLQFGTILGGTVVIEMVFSWPGVGQLIVNAILTRDYLVVQAAVLLLAIFFLIVNLIVDFIYTILNPRIELT
ncbi:MAG: ABC transporter permease [Deltaproteobacteria bacterium]|nr:ABC transporter permease [Deltaproteobacteria bacterium]